MTSTGVSGLAAVEDPPTPLITELIPPSPWMLRKIVKMSWNCTPGVTGDWKACVAKIGTPWLKNE
jgi:hypothetical protein